MSWYGTDLLSPVHRQAMKGFTNCFWTVWSWLVDKRNPDFYDVAGGAVVLLGVAMIMYWPRGAAA